MRQWSGQSCLISEFLGKIEEYGKKIGDMEDADILEGTSGVKKDVEGFCKGQQSSQGEFSKFQCQITICWSWRHHLKTTVV
jgi:hypothetical protein